MKVPVNSRQVKAWYTLTFDAKKENTGWMQFVKVWETDQLDGEKFGNRVPGTGVVEEGSDQGAFETPAYEGFVVRNRNWKLNRTIPAEDIERNRVSRVMDTLDEIANLAVFHPFELVEAMILAGETTYKNPFDTSKYFFDTDHPLRNESTQSNLYSGDGTHTTNALFRATDVTAPTDAEWATILFESAKILMMMVNDAGQRIQRNVRSFTAMTGSTLWTSMVQFLSKNALASGASNVVRDNVQGFKWNPMLLPGTASNKMDELYVAINGEKPMILQQLEGTDFSKIKVFGPGTEHYDLHEEMLIKAKSTYNVSFGYYQGFLKIKITAKGS